MEKNPNTSSTSSKSGQKLKTLVAQGLIGTISLAGATAIPIVIKHLLEPPVEATTPTGYNPVDSSPVVAPAAVTSPSVESPQKSSVQPPSAGELIEIDSYSGDDLSEDEDNNKDDSMKLEEPEKPEKRNRGKNK